MYWILKFAERYSWVLRLELSLENGFCFLWPWIKKYWVVMVGKIDSFNKSWLKLSGLLVCLFLGQWSGQVSGQTK